MAGSPEQGRKAAATNERLYGKGAGKESFYVQIGRKGGKQMLLNRERAQQMAHRSWEVRRARKAAQERQTNELEETTK